MRTPDARLGYFPQLAPGTHAGEDADAAKGLSAKTGFPRFSRGVPEAAAPMRRMFPKRGRCKLLAVASVAAALRGVALILWRKTPCRRRYTVHTERLLFALCLGVNDRLRAAGIGNPDAGLAAGAEPYPGDRAERGATDLMWIMLACN